MRRLFAVVNPAAGGGATARAWPSVRDAITAAGGALEWAATKGPREGARLAREAAAAGWPLVVAVGGDGTLNEVVDGVMAAGGSACVGAVPTGRGRDACRDFGIARTPRDAARRLLTGQAAAVDVGVGQWPDGGRRCFLIALGAGFDAVVARRAALGGGSGTLPYLRAVVASLAAHAPVETSVELDGVARWQGPATAVVVANAAYYGGGMRIAPAAAPDDGVLDVIILGNLGRLELLRWLPSIYRGTHLRNPHLAALRACRVRITSALPLLAHVDGEAAPSTPLEVSVLRGGVRLIR